VDDTTPFSATTLWGAFRRAVARDPDAPALILPSESVSFGVLQADAERCAAWLAERGIGRGDVVAIQLPKRRETYPLWLGCLRQGVIYVFVDPKNPEERTQRILQRVRPSALFTTGDSTNPFGDVVRLPEESQGSVWLDTLPLPAQSPRAADLHGLAPAYIMFTSGSTGEPKGAVIPHQGVLSLMRWAWTRVGTPTTERFANINPLHFDNSVFDLYCGLVNGATLVAVETSALSNPMSWIKLLQRGRASVLFAVPTLFLTLDRLRLLRPDLLPEVRMFLFGGEGFPIETLRRFFERFAGRARLVNVYGPTETSCICSSIEVNEAEIAAAGENLLSLGRMHDDFDYAVLDADGVSVPRGAVGELWIGGACVGLGYYANPEETVAKFRQDPRQDRYRSIWYRSGDLVREDERGTLWFQGRSDNQVKIRGHRIELEEIDLAVEQIDGVRRAVCVAVPVTDGGLELRVAYTADRTVDEAVVRTHCERRLPAYMRPATIIQVENLPQNANGKVDRKAVRVMMEKQS
jgi:D-alanine--poly(phosphoribitol) ligase subunit 1